MPTMEAITEQEEKEEEQRKMQLDDWDVSASAANEFLKCHDDACNNKSSQERNSTNDFVLDGLFDHNRPFPCSLDLTEDRMEASKSFTEPVSQPQATNTSDHLLFYTGDTLTFDHHHQTTTTAAEEQHDEIMGSSEEYEEETLPLVVPVLQQVELLSLDVALEQEAQHSSDMLVETPTQLALSSDCMNKGNFSQIHIEVEKMNCELTDNVERNAIDCVGKGDGSQIHVDVEEAHSEPTAHEEQNTFDSIVEGDVSQIHKETKQAPSEPTAREEKNGIDSIGKGDVSQIHKDTKETHSEPTAHEDKNGIDSIEVGDVSQIHKDAKETPSEPTAHVEQNVERLLTTDGDDDQSYNSSHSNNNCSNPRALLPTNKMRASTSRERLEKEFSDFSCSDSEESSPPATMSFTNEEEFTDADSDNNLSRLSDTQELLVSPIVKKKKRLIRGIISKNEGINKKNNATLTQQEFDETVAAIKEQEKRVERHKEMILGENEENALLARHVELREENSSLKKSLDQSKASVKKLTASLGKLNRKYSLAETQIKKSAEEIEMLTRRVEQKDEKITLLKKLALPDASPKNAVSANMGNKRDSAESTLMMHNDRKSMKASSNGLGQKLTLHTSPSRKGKSTMKRMAARKKKQVEVSLKSKFKSLWPRLANCGWSYRTGPEPYNMVYVPPGGNTRKGARENIDFYAAESQVILSAQELDGNEEVLESSEPDARGFETMPQDANKEVVNNANSSSGSQSSGADEESLDETVDNNLLGGLFTSNVLRQCSRLMKKFCCQPGNSEHNFKAKLWKPIWVILRSQGSINADNLKWTYVKTAKLAHMANWVYGAPNTRGVRSGSLGIDYFLTEEEVTARLLSEIVKFDSLLLDQVTLKKIGSICYTEGSCSNDDTRKRRKRPHSLTAANEIDFTQAKDKRMRGTPKPTTSIVKATEVSPWKSAARVWNTSNVNLGISQSAVDGVHMLLEISKREKAHKSPSETDGDNESVELLPFNSSAKILSDDSNKNKQQRQQLDVPQLHTGVKVRFDDNDWYKGTIVSVINNTSTKSTTLQQYMLQIQYEDGSIDHEAYPAEGIILLSNDENSNSNQARSVSRVMTEDSPSVGAKSTEMFSTPDRGTDRGILKLAALRADRTCNEEEKNVLMKSVECLPTEGATHKSPKNHLHISQSPLTSSYYRKEMIIKHSKHSDILKNHSFIISGCAHVKQQLARMGGNVVENVADISLKREDIAGRLWFLSEPSCRRRTKYLLAAALGLPMLHFRCLDDLEQGKASGIFDNELYKSWRLPTGLSIFSGIFTLQRARHACAWASPGYENGQVIFQDMTFMLALEDATMLQDWSSILEAVGACVISTTHKRKDALKKVDAVLVDSMLLSPQNTATPQKIEATLRSVHVDTPVVDLSWAVQSLIARRKLDFDEDSRFMKGFDVFSMKVKGQAGTEVRYEKGDAVKIRRNSKGDICHARITNIDLKERMLSVEVLDLYGEDVLIDGGRNGVSLRLPEKDLMSHAILFSSKEYTGLAYADSKDIFMLRNRKSPTESNKTKD